MKDFIKNIPKVELHMHVEGSMEAETLWKLANNNNCRIEYKTIDELKAAYKFKNLTEFIDMYMLGTRVIKSEQDLYDVCMQYFKSCVKQKIQHTEVHCDIRTYIDYGYSADFVINALDGAFKDAKINYGITGGFMPCFIRHLGNDTAKQDLDLLLPFKDKILAIGLASIELGYPPSLFIDTFKRVKGAGINIIAHAGEEAPAEYIWSAIKDIGVDRIDHGISCMEDGKLVEYLVETQIPLTVCPYSNVALNIFDNISQHVLPAMLLKGLNVSIHSDDPVHFNANLTDNFIGVYEGTSLTINDIIKLSENAINSSFTSTERKLQMTKKLNSYCKEFL